MIEIAEAIAGYLGGKEKANGYKAIGQTSLVIGVVFFIVNFIYVVIDSSGEILAINEKSFLFFLGLFLFSIAISLFVFIIFSIAKWQKQRKDLK